MAVHELGRLELRILLPKKMFQGHIHYTQSVTERVKQQLLTMTVKEVIPLNSNP